MSDFTSFIQELLGNPNPKGGMMGSSSTFYNTAAQDDYYKNPYRMQDSIDEALKKKKAADDALKKALGVPVDQGSGGSSGGQVESVYGNYGSDGLAPETLGTGLMSDAITDNALNAASLGMNLAGPLGAILGGGGSYALGMLGAMNTVNAQSDPLGFLATQQGWYDGRDTPAPVMTGAQVQAMEQQAAAINAQSQARIDRQGSRSSGNSHDAGITGGNSFGGNNADGGGYNE